MNSMILIGRDTLGRTTHCFKNTTGVQQTSCGKAARHPATHTLTSYVVDNVALDRGKFVLGTRASEH